jgi:hypothetical protein
MSSGTPRKRSTYPVASARIGKNTAPRRVRSTAIRRPSASTPISATTSTRMLSHSPARIAGSDDHAVDGSRNVARTRGQPGELVSPISTTAAKTAVDATATSVERRARERR